ncbi:YkvA family protein [Chryseobacterium sp. SNU WT5]|uniref:YkvA family protein n=1 Tax=Chryseobacterium sp. SNU WT5 TaxID=2594269 RepID=UPI00397739DF
MKISKIQLAKEAFKHKGFIQKIPVIIRMIKSATKKGGYKPQFTNVVVPALVLVYLISPIDIIPDFIPGIGVLDDFALLAFAIPLLVKEAEKFIAWEVSNKAEDKVSEAQIIA